MAQLALREKIKKKNYKSTAYAFRPALTIFFFQARQLLNTQILVYEIEMESPYS